MSLMRLRARMPLLVFILLAVLCAVLVGFACACLTEHPMQAVDRFLAGFAASPALVAVWSEIALVGALVLLMFLRAPVLAARASPSLLQRFLF